SVERDLDDPAGFSRLRDRLDHAQVLQAVAPGDERLFLAADHLAEMRYLPRERVIALERKRLRLEWLEPPAILVAPAATQAHRGTGEGATAADDHVRILVGIRRVRPVLLRRLLPALRRCRRVREQERAERGVGEAQVDRDRVLDLELARCIR